MMNIFKIWKSELITIFKDPGSLLIMVGAIFLYSIFYTMPFSNHVLKEVPIGVVDMDNSSFSRELTRDINSSQYVDVVSYPVDKEQAQELYFKDKIKGYVVIAPNFEKDLYQGKNSNIGVFVDSAYIIIYKQIMTGISESTMTYSGKIEVGRLVKAGLNKNVAIRVKKPFEFVQVPLFNPAGSYQNYIFPLILALILQQTMLLGACLLGGTRKELMVRARRLGYSDVKFCDISNNPIEIILGRSLAYCSLYFCYALMYLLLFPLLFCYVINYNILTLFTVLIPYLFAVSLLAQTLIAFMAERETSLLFFVVLSLPMVFFPGYVWPKESMPLWIRIFSSFVPSTNGIDGIVRVDQLGANFAQVEPNVLILIILCVVYFTTAYFVTKKLCK